MKALICILIINLTYGVHSFADEKEKTDCRNETVLKSRLINSVLLALKEEQGLNCQIAIEESGNPSIVYFDEGGRSKFQAAYVCDDSSFVYFKGIVGDGEKVFMEAILIEKGGS